MKKILVLTTALLLAASSAFASADLTSANGKLVFGDSVGTDNFLHTEGIGLSPKVVAKYIGEGDSTITAQWYAIATVHPGGNVAYGTAQNVNNIFHHTYVTGAAASTVLDTIPATKASESEWDSNDWDR